MGMKCPSLLAWGALTALSLLIFDFRESVARSETRYCDNIVYL